MLAIACKLVIAGLLNLSLVGVTPAQGVYRVLFADLAVIDVEPEIAIDPHDGYYVEAGEAFSLTATIDNLGDLPARQSGAELRVFGSASGSLWPARRILVPQHWQYTGVVFLHDGTVPHDAYLNSLQGGLVTAHGLRLPARPDIYHVRVCIVYPLGEPFGDDTANNCSIDIPVSVKP